MVIEKSMYAEKIMHKAEETDHILILPYIKSPLRIVALDMEESEMSCFESS